MNRRIVNNIIYLTSVSLAFVLIIMSFTKPFIALCTKNDVLDVLRLSSSLFLGFPIYFYLQRRTKRWKNCLVLCICFPIMVFQEEFRIKVYRDELSADSTYFIATGVSDHLFYNVGYSSSVISFSTLQMGGYDRILIDSDEHYDTVLMAISYENNYTKVVDMTPTPAEIQKYMEPVLFIDGVEQPRPEYDDLKLSDEERRDLLREHHIEVARVVKKERDKFLRNLVTLQVNDTVQKTVNLMYKDEPDYDDIFDSLNEESYVLVKVSDINPKVIEVADWQPTPENVKKVRNQMRKPIIATIYDKHLKQVHWGSQIKRFYMVRLQFSDTITDYIKIEDIRRRQIFESLHVGDAVLVKMTEGKTKSVNVLNWHPTPEQIEKYKTPVRLIEKNQ